MPELSRETEALLDDLERRIDPETEDDYISQWSDFLFDRFTGEIFAPKRKHFSEPGVVTRHVRINEALGDYDAMLYSQMEAVYSALAPRAAEARRSYNLAIRANYGTGILSSLFGAELFVMPDEADTLPTTRPLKGEDAMREVLEKGIPDFRMGLAQGADERPGAVGAAVVHEDDFIGERTARGGRLAGEGAADPVDQFGKRFRFVVERYDK